MADFGADGVAGDVQPLPDLARGEMGLQVRQEPELRAGEGCLADYCHLRSLAEERGNWATSSTSAPRAGRWSRMSSISRSMCRAVVWSGMTAYTLASCSRTCTAR